MSNSNDPNPEQPKPTDAEAAKAAEEARRASAGSSFDFVLPGESFSDLPPVASPDGSDSAVNQAALPPRPAATRPVSGTFDFIELPEVDLAGSDPLGLGIGTPQPAKPVPPVGAPPLLVPTPNAVDLPPAPSLLVPTPNAVDLPAPAAPMAFTISSSDIDLGALPEPPSAQIPVGFAASAPEVAIEKPGDSGQRTIPTGFAVSAADIAAPTPAAPSSSGIPSGVIASSGEVNLTPPVESSTPSAQVPIGFPASSSDIDIVLPPEGPPSSVIPSGFITSSGDVDLASASDHTPSSQVPIGFAASSPEIELPPMDTPVIPDAFAASSADIDIGALPDLPIAQPLSDVQSVADIGTLFPTSDPPSSFVLGQQEAPAAPQAPSDPSVSFLLPPLPEPPKTDPSVAAIKSMGSSGEFEALPTAGGQSVPDINVLYSPPAGSFAAGDPAMADLDLPPVPADATGSSVGLDKFKPVEPSEDWVGSSIHKGQPQPSAFPQDPTEGSDIFLNPQPITPPPADHSDVIAATAYSPKPLPAGDLPSDVGRPSDVAITYEPVPGGSTIDEGDSDNLPLAPDLGSDSDLLGAQVSDHESIHDLPDPAANPLFEAFDSSTLPEASLPVGPTGDDVTDYAAPPELASDASSILSGLTDPAVDLQSDSSVLFDKPGMGGTLSGAPVGSKFDLTPDDEDITGLLGEPDAESNDWRKQADSGLFERPSEPDGTRPSPANRTPLDPLEMTPSSIFHGSRPAPGSDSVPPDQLAAALEPTDPELEDAEFTAKPANPPLRRPSSGEIELPDEGVDMNAVSRNDDAPVNARLDQLLGGLTDDSNETPQANVARVISDDSDGTGRPSVTLDYVSESAEGPAMGGTRGTPAAKKGKDTREPDFTEKKTKPSAVPKDKPKADRSSPARLASDTSSGTAERLDSEGAQKRKRESRSLITGVLLGGLLAAGASAGVYISGAIPNSEPKTVVVNQNGGSGGTGSNGGGGPVAAAPAEAQTLLDSGNLAKALELVNKKEPATVEEKATDGAVRTFALVQSLNGPAAPDDSELRKARTSLTAVINDAEGKPEREKAAVLATVRLGVTHLLAGDRTTARKLYTDAAAKYKSHAATFEALLAKMDAEDAPGAGTSFNAPRRLTPAEAEQLLLAVTVLLRQDDPKADPEEPGVHYWKAVKLAGEGKYAEAIVLIGKAKAAHVARAKALAGRGLNPLTDPLEQMFARSCDEMAAGWKLKEQLYGNPAIAAAIKKDGLPKTLDGFAKVQTDLATANANLKTATDNLTTANNKVTKLEGDVGKLDKDAKAAKQDAMKYEMEAKTAKDDAAKFDKEAKAAKMGREEAEANLKTAMGNLKTATDKLAVAEKDVMSKDDLIAKVAAELKTAKILGEKWAPAELVAGVKTAASLAKGPDAERLVKAEKAAKEALEKLDTTRKELTTKHEGDIAKLKDEYAAEVKKFDDKLKVELKKQSDAHAIALKAEQDRTATEKEQTAAAKKLLADQAIAFQKQLGNAITPAQTVDIWLPVLTDLRRASDAEPALAIADRALKSSAPGSEEEAKARATTGMALLLKNDLTGAKTQFLASRNSPAYKAAAGKYWTKVVDNGLDAITDPLALYRVPVVVPLTDPKIANRALDAGIGAYRAGKYDVAALALADAAKNDPSDPVAWYYLGAARWEKGEEEQAKKDIAQGAEREKRSVVPARLVSAILAPIQGAARDAIDKARP